MLHADLDDITAVIPSAVIDVRYATTSNFTGEQLYIVQRALLRHEPLQKLANACKFLEEHGYRLVVFDAFRARSVQQRLRSVCGDSHYVAEVSNHCRGITVDVTLATANNVYLDMGTEYDDFSEKAHPGSPEITEAQEHNRNILLHALATQGFVQHPYEWWHFDYHPDREWAIIDDESNAYKQ